jgi:hypothetical protein
VTDGFLRTVETTVAASICRQTTRAIGGVCELEQHACRERGVCEVREDPVDTQVVALQIFVDRVALGIGYQAKWLVAERIRVHQQPMRVCPLHEVGWWECLTVSFVNLVVAVHVSRVAVAVEGNRRCADDVTLPGADAIGVGLDFAQSRVRHKEIEPACKEAKDKPVLEQLLDLLLQRGQINRE